MKFTIHPSSERGAANHGWLKSFHSFSFANFYNPQKMNFGALRVLNDDNVSGGMGFGKHPHDNMEIISIPLNGALEHEDSMGNKTIITTGEVQIMSAGTGVTHSEKNQSSKENVEFLQIWIMPKTRNISPSYDQKIFEEIERAGKFQTLVSPKNLDELGVKINQDAWISRVDLKNEEEISYNLHKEGNGVYFFILEGSSEIENQKLNNRDALGIEEASEIKIKALGKTSILALEVPMIL